MTRMKEQNFAGLFAGLCLCAAPLVAQAQVTIMPMGDSVTARGSFPESSYRYWLYTDLTNAGFDVVFSGNQNGVSDGSPANTWPQERYEGGGTGGDAWTSNDGVNAAPSAARTTPDILILDLGSNDILQPDGFDPGTTETNLETIIDDFAAANPNIIVLLARPTPFEVDPSATPQQQREERQGQSKLASLMSKVASVEKKAGVNVIVVNQFGGFNVRTDTKDGTHPNVAGEQKIASRYFQELRRILKHM
jgi:lysophospholipase L1-like esterase